MVVQETGISYSGDPISATEALFDKTSCTSFASALGALRAAARNPAVSGRANEAINRITIAHNGATGAHTASCPLNPLFTRS